MLRTCARCMLSSHALQVLAQADFGPRRTAAVYTDIHHFLQVGLTCIGLASAQFELQFRYGVGWSPGTVCSLKLQSACVVYNVTVKVGHSSDRD